ncbi:hypothetical protein B566_EDAN001582 [Ephemera danica]|nr:hypothetical protein B566_EDAN001582 [Ephemera danica]
MPSMWILVVLAVVHLHDGHASPMRLAGDENPLMCGNLKPLTNISLPQFQGYWVLLSAFEFAEGIATPSAPEESEECNRYLYENATANGMDEYAEQSLPKHWLEPIEAFRSHLTVRDGDPGRWEFNSSKPTGPDESISVEDESAAPLDDMLILMADPKLYMVVASCPPRSVTIPQHQNFVRLVSILSRSEKPQEKSLVTGEKLLEIEEMVTRTLDFAPVPHVQQRTDC